MPGSRASTSRKEEGPREHEPAPARSAYHARSPEGWVAVVTDDKRNPPAAHQGAPTDTGIVSRNGLREEVVIFQVPGVGNVVAVLPVVPEDAPYPVREGVARRRLVAVTGRCPCGARLDLQAMHGNPAGAVDVKHDARCPAATHRLLKAVRRWTR